MNQVKLNKKSKYGAKNTVLEVTGNVAHSIVDGGLGKIYKPKPFYKNRMVTSARKRVMKTRRV